MCTDDILLTLSRPKSSLPAVLNLINNFGCFSGYCINWNKSEAMPLNSFTFKTDLGDTPFAWQLKGIEYLVINIISPVTEIFSLNGPVPLCSVQDDIDRWTILPVSLWGTSFLMYYLD